MLTSILIGVISSIISSLLFLYFFLARKVPIIEISDLIAKEPDGKYWFKYVNRTDVPVYDVKCEVYLLTPIGGDGGQNLIIDEIRTNRTVYTQVPCESKLDRNALHAVQVQSLEDLVTKWSNSASFVRFQVVAKHELSGFSKVFVKDYHKRTKICNGSFKFGNELGIS